MTDDLDHESRSGRVADAFVGAVREMTNEERLNAFTIIKASYCIHCGRYHGDDWRGCQCWNDE